MDYEKNTLAYNYIREMTTVAEAQRSHTWVRQIAWLLTMWVLVEFEHLCDLLESVQLT